ncbi:hypothetical protein HS088_TW08G00090 [Tripterygium wilfordii]|uniref:Transport protein SEC31 n=1 Tax=Tripterygium wilfordii TaxID=458696 RepID=A0A7J7DBS0_TRIWF|nr:uncharacterized protein LOC120004029 [Tripterygium wilfordii]XP_038709168.1 uncharacterized protein LOC120004029 [Tripterygium wilfordii]KAF5743506.1 hypothetical protein HS088_TW08G00090 [Tripterygium wilfordii]
MDNVACNKVQPVVRKAKKKQAKGELDHLKQAEKKKRRLEKALATSAAIRSELEKKKQKKIEEQQRLDEEGAAIAEAVALHVLLGEDSDDPCKIMLNREEGFNPWHCAENFHLFMGERRAYLPHQDHVSCPLEGLGWVSNGYEHGYKLGDHESGDWSLSYAPIERSLRAPYFDDAGWDTAQFSAGLLAAQAVSSLQIAEDAHVDTVVLDGILRG